MIFRLEIGILLGGEVAGAFLGDMRQLTVAENAGLGILGSEFLQQFVERVLLGIGASIGSNAVLIQTTFIDDTEGTVVVVAGMYTLDALRQQGNDIAIAADVVVVRALTILGHSASNEVLHTEGTIAFISHAVDYQQLHGIMLQWFHLRRI